MPIMDKLPVNWMTHCLYMKIECAFLRLLSFSHCHSVTYVGLSTTGSPAQRHRKTLSICCCRDYVTPAVTRGSCGRNYCSLVRFKFINSTYCLGRTDNVGIGVVLQLLQKLTNDRLVVSLPCYLNLRKKIY